MKRKESFLPAFLAVAFLCLIVLVLSLSGNLKFLSSFLEKGTSAIQSVTSGIFNKMPFISQDSKTKDLQNKNLELLSKVADFERLKRENAALSDQFHTNYPASYQLLEAKVIGAPGFIPGVSLPNNFILNKGSKDNLKVGHAVVVKDNLVGLIKAVSENLSKVNLITNSNSSFTAKTQNGTLGVAKGTGASLTLDNVLLSENMRTGELVLTKGDIDFEGVGSPPDLIVGKIISIEKSASDLFQKAKVESFIDFPKVSTVFIYINTK